MSNELDVEAKDGKAAFAELTKRGYDKAACFRYARAARSWTEKGSSEWNVWLEVEALASPTRA
jgi:hypothetical protein